MRNLNLAVKLYGKELVDYVSELSKSNGNNFTWEYLKDDKEAFDCFLLICF
jgi:hypothetical protein